MAKKLTPLTVRSIADLSDGQTEAVINHAFAAAVRDTDDRGDDDKARKVTITFEFKKADQDHITVNSKVKIALPDYATKPTIGTIIVNGNNRDIEFDVDDCDSENPKQRSLPLNGDDEA